MRKIYTLPCLILSLLVLNGCPEDSYKVEMPKKPKLNLDDIDLSRLDALSTLWECREKGQAEEVSQEALENGRELTPTVNVAKLEYLNCEGEVIKDIDSVDDLYFQTLLVMPPLEVGPGVQFAEVENKTTCSRIVLRAEDVSGVHNDFGDETVTPEIFKSKSQMSLTGAISLIVTNWSYNIGPIVSLSDGRNLVKIRYYSTCEAMTDKDGKESVQCDDKNLLATKEMAVDFNPTLVKVEEPKQVDRCEKETEDAKTTSN